MSAYTGVTVAIETEHDNTVSAADFPVEDLITTSQSAAYREAFIGEKITYQVPAMAEDYCPGCDATADAVVECSAHAHLDVQLSESERKDLFS
ncbi:MAG: hypothetical protein A07HR67_01399 [uncultured archaeon A07HR67]|nr:MAG: hypothetical protein A07HR67_01399 [uncultured archaeon A07HR67]